MSCVLALCGAGGALGPAVVERLAAAGTVLALAGRDAARIEALRAPAEARGAEVEAAAVDFEDETATGAWASTLAASRGRVDGVVHMVGGWRGGQPIDAAPLGWWDELAGPLVRTAQVVSRAFAPHLIASGGSFVLVSTAQAQAPTSGNAAYAAAKAAAEAWTLALADRFRGTGARANVVAVGGGIVTQAMRAERPGEAFAGSTPAEDVAEAIAYLLAPEASRVSGQRLTLRGAF